MCLFFDLSGFSTDRCRRLESSFFPSNVRRVDSTSRSHTNLEHVFLSLRIMMEACHSQNFKKHLNFWLQVPHPATSLDGSKHQLWASILLWRLKSYRLKAWADRLSMQESTRERGLPRPAISIISHAQVLRWSFLDFHCPKVNGLLIFSRWLTLTAMVYSTSQSLLQ